jgi:hypothetical protein
MNILLVLDLAQFPFRFCRIWYCIWTIEHFRDLLQRVSSRLWEEEPRYCKKYSQEAADWQLLVDKLI